MDIDAARSLESAGYVYAMSTESLSLRGIYKIGFTGDIDQRREKLSQGTSVPDEFFIEHFVRCPNIADARKLEAWIKNELNNLGARHHKGREFYRVGTTVGLVGCFAQGAKELGIEIIQNVRASPQDILENADDSILSDRNLDSIDPIFRKYYLRGAQDLAALLMLASTGRNVDRVTADVMSQLNGSNLTHGKPTNLIEAVESAMKFHFGIDQANSFRSEVKFCQQSDCENRLFGNDDDLSEWPRFIRTDLNWPNVAT